ncbi:hypothetical protein C0995_000403 [Termitomyces sp. Mi166|nr:hypothetical protein C0995_000403 [Termitomyces sp. Mi166\
MKLSIQFVSLVVCASTALAQSPLYGGGRRWIGPTTCVAGSVCKSINDSYYQCLPGTGTTTTSTSFSISAINANYWFSFGDSYTQTGFDPMLTLPSVGNPLGNPTYPGWTSSGGENWVDYITTKYNNSLLFTYNYAYGGATIDATLVPPYTPTVLSVTDQVNQFLSSAGTKPMATPWTSVNSLFSIWIGINDLGNSYYLDGDRDAFSDKLLDVLFAQVQKLMTAQGIGATSLLASVIAGFNGKLITKSASFKANNTGVTTYFWDSHAQFSAILDDPSDYGFIDNSTIGSNSGAFWFNDLHPTSYAHRYFGQQVGQVVLKNTIW